MLFYVLAPTTFESFSTLGDISNPIYNYSTSEDLVVTCVVSASNIEKVSIQLRGTDVSEQYFHKERNPDDYCGGGCAYGLSKSYKEEIHWKAHELDFTTCTEAVYYDVLQQQQQLETLLILGQKKFPSKPIVCWQISHKHIIAKSFQMNIRACFVHDTQDGARTILRTSSTLEYSISKMKFKIRNITQILLTFCWKSHPKNRKSFCNIYDIKMTSVKSQIVLFLKLSKLIWIENVYPKYGFTRLSQLYIELY